MLFKWGFWNFMIGVIWTQCHWLCLQQGKKCGYKNYVIHYSENQGIWWKGKKQSWIRILKRKMAHIHCEFTPLMIKVTAFISQKKKAHMVQRLERVLNLSSTKADSWSGLPHHGVWDLARTYVTHVCDCQKSRCTVCVYDVRNCQETDAQSVCVCVCGLAGLIVGLTNRWL